VRHSGKTDWAHEDVRREMTRAIYTTCALRVTAAAAEDQSVG